MREKFAFFALVGASIYISVFFVANLVLPYGNHILLASGMVEPSGKEIFYFSKSTSRMFLKINKLNCEIPLYDKNVKPIGNYPTRPAISLLFIFFDRWSVNMTEADKEFFSSFTLRVIDKCSQHPITYTEEIHPIIYAIISHKVEFVDRLLKNGVSKNFKINRPGRPADGMNPEEYAKYLAKNEKNELNRVALLKISTLLSHE